MESSNQLAQKRVEATETRELSNEGELNSAIESLNFKNAQELK